MVHKIFFAPNFPLFRKSGGEKKKKGNYEAFCFLSKRIRVVKNEHDQINFQLVYRTLHLNS